MLNDEIYAGVYYANRFTTIEDEHGKKKVVRTPREEWIPIAVPAIVPRDLWERCQERLARGRTEAVRGHGKYNYLLARRCTCRICEYAVVGNTDTKKVGQAYYFCRSKRFDVIRKGCDLPYFRVDDTDYTVWEYIKRLLNDPRAMLASMQEAQEVQRKQHADLERRIREVDELIAQHQNDLDELVRDYREARSKLLYETLERQAQEVEEQITGLRNRREQYLAQLNERVLSDQEIQSLEEFAAEVRPKLPMADYALKRMIIERLSFYFQLTVENGQRVVYIIWLTYEFPEPIEGAQSGRRGSRGQPGSGSGGNHADMASLGGLENVLRYTTCRSSPWMATSVDARMGGRAPS
jgi:site-specific DNA recombinase